MIDLHLHLDGSLPPGLLLRMAAIEGVRLPAKEEEALKPFLTAPVDCGSLNEYLEKFDLPISCMQSPESLELAGAGLLRELASQGMIYAEIRFAPQFHCRKGLTQSRAVEAVVRGMKKAQEQTGMKAGLILCCMRGNRNHEENLETVRVAAEYLGKGVCALDLAGAEALFSTGEFEDLFALANEYSVPYTIHAGEAAGPESVWKALEFGAKRIGHGVRSAEDPELLEELKRRGTFLEMCVTSNLQTKAIPEEKAHPILAFLRRGIRVTVNTDNMTVSGTTIEKEFRLLEEMGMQKAEKRRLLLHSVEAAFLGEEEKEKLREQIDRKLERI